MSSVQKSHFTSGELELLILECLRILKGYNLHIRPISRVSDTHYHLFANDLLDFLSLKAELREEPPLVIDPRLTPKFIDLVTIEWATVCVRHGILDIHYNEALNSLRVTLRSILKDAGYQLPKMCHVFWAAYETWPAMARLAGLSDERIEEVVDNHLERSRDLESMRR